MYSSISSAVKHAKYSDFLLKSTNGTGISVHKAIVMPQSGFLQKMYLKTPKKAEYSVDISKSILDSAVQFFYSGNYIVSPKFRAEWNIPDDMDNRLVEFTFKLYRAADLLEIIELKDLTLKNLHNFLKSGVFSDQLCGNLQKVDKKKTEPPPGIIEAVIATQALKVKTQYEAGKELNTAFRMAARAIRGDFLSEFVVAVGDALGARFRTYLRCPECAMIIRNKNEKSNKFVCTRGDCIAKDKEGELVPIPDVGV
jgi:hypothetical protein